MARMTQRRKIHRFRIDSSGTEYPIRFKEDVLAAEEPLEIRIGGKSFAVTMRTPGDDFDLVAGFLVSEGIIRSQSELVSLRFCAGDTGGTQTFNVIEAQLRPDVVMPDTMRHVYTSSSCGICGITRSKPFARHSISTPPRTSCRFPWMYSPNCRTGFARPKLCSRRPEVFMQRACLGWMARARICFVFGRT